MNSDINAPYKVCADIAAELDMEPDEAERLLLYLLQNWRHNCKRRKE